MEFLILLFRVIYIILLGYTLTSLIAIFLVAFFRHIMPVHTSGWAFGLCMFNKTVEGALGFYILTQGVVFFITDLQGVLMSLWLKYVLATFFTVAWIFHVELHRGREESFWEVDGSNHLKYRYDFYYMYAVKTVLILQVYGSLLFGFYLSFYPLELKAFLSRIYLWLVFF